MTWSSLPAMAFTWWSTSWIFFFVAFWLLSIFLYSADLLEFDSTAPASGSSSSSPVSSFILTFRLLLPTISLPFTCFGPFALRGFLAFETSSTAGYSFFSAGSPSLSSLTRYGASFAFCSSSISSSISLAFTLSFLLKGSTN